MKTPWLLLLLLLVGCPSGGGGDDDDSTAASDPCEGLPTTEGTSVELREFATGLSGPLHLTHAGDGTSRMFVVEQPGRIQTVTPAGVVAPWLDLTDRVGYGGERGLLSVAFHPDFASNGRFFVYYTNLPPQGSAVISEFKVEGDTATELPDPDSEIVLLTIEQPAANHNGGQVAFGPDGMLYIGTGDGGAAGDLFGNGQNKQSLLAKLMRVDVDHGAPYTVPDDNPFVGDGDYRPEIWAWGLRNPWRFSFDSETGELWLGDVGQDAVEEVNVIEAGGNYGWPEAEGDRCYTAGCNLSAYDPPVWIKEHPLSVSITGGVVYRGCALPDLRGTYFFSDYNYFNSPLWSLDWDGSQATAGPVDIGATGAIIAGFGADRHGEVYALDHGGGRILKLVAR